MPSPKNLTNPFIISYNASVSATQALEITIHTLNNLQLIFSLNQDLNPRITKSLKHALTIVTATLKGDIHQ